jgi:putative transposase
MSVREIQSYLLEMYDTEVSPDLISKVTDNVIEEVRAWQNRPLERIYPIVYLDAIRVEIRDNARILNKAVYIALGVNMDGRKEVLGMWIVPTEGAKFWLGVITEIKNRGVQDIFIVCVDGLKGFPEAIETVFPQTQVQLCIVHMIRHSLRYVSWKNRKDIAVDLKKIYSAATADAAREKLTKFRAKWDNQYPTIGASWDRNWEDIVGFLAYPDYIRKAIYTTNAIESINNSLRKLTKNRGAFPNDESVVKLLYLDLRNVSRRWTLPIRQRKQALNQFAIFFEDRFPFGEE